MVPRAAELLATLDLKKHPEGGYYRQVHKSPHEVDPRDGRPLRAALTAIYFLLPQGEISRWHRVRSDEIWSHLEGAPVRLHLYDGTQATSAVVERMHVVPANVWQAAEPTGDYALVACFVAPGFEFEDFEMADEKDHGRACLPATLPLR